MMMPLPKCGYRVERMTAEQRAISRVEERIDLLWSVAEHGSEGMLHFALGAVGRALNKALDVYVAADDGTAILTNIERLEQSLGPDNLRLAYSLANQ